MPTPESAGSIDWDLVSEVLSEALARPAHARDAWVDKQARVNEATAAEIKSLIRAAERNDELSAEALGQAASEQEPSGEDGEPAPERSQRFGPYETVRILGRGGMGVVYLARRVDGEFDQTVALKVIAAPFSGEDFVRRFRTERQLLAGLKHPNITRLLDGGVSPDGDPYLVMEYIEGEPLDRYCDSAQLSIAARLRLFLQLLDAVDFAHRNLILHRDLKPSNVLVTEGGVVKLLDFGTAALIPQTEAVQVTRARMLTPRYASPGQLRGERSSVADDVFSLGVIFYELLSGAWPFGDPHSMVGELKRATTETQPAPLASALTSETASRRGLSPPSLSRMLAGDLSAIALKALESDPQRRYATVAQFAADIERYLEGRPVEARPQTALYRGGKFLRRHWLPVSAAALFVCGMSLSAVVAARAARTARAEAAKATAVNRFLNGMLSSTGDTRFDPARYTVVEMLDSASSQLEKRPPADARTAAVLHLSLARSYVALARWEKVELHLKRAAPVLRAVNDRQNLADALATQAYVEELQGRQEAAIGHYREALANYAQLGREAPAEEVFDVKSAYAQLLSLILNRSMADVKPLYDDLLATGARDPSIPRTKVAKAMANWALVLGKEGRASEAERTLLDALATGRKEDPGAMWELAPLMTLAWGYSNRHDWSRAAEAGRRMIEICVKNVGPDSPDTASARMIWARNAVMSGEKESAVAAVRQAMPIIEKAFPPPSLNLWSAARNASIVLFEAGSCSEAGTYARRAISVIEAAGLAADDPRPAESWHDLGDTLACQGKKAEAADALRHAAQILERGGGKWSQQLAEVHARIASLEEGR